jgi:type IV pilus assembly protein PilE
MKKQRGVTLIELIVVMVIVGILAAIAIPTYRQYIIKANRRAAQSVMLDIGSRERQYFLANRVYATKAQLAYALPPDVTGNYTYDIALDAGPPPGFTITFTATGGQVDDGDLTFNSDGTKGPAGKW